MKLRDELYFDVISNYIEYFRENKQKFNIMVQVQEGTELSKLPQEAYYNGLFHATFDFGSEETWVADQIILEDNLFKCIVVYFVNKEWKEYQIEFPVINIVGISRITGTVGTVGIAGSMNLEFPSEEIGQSFRNKVENSKKHLKLVSKLSEEEE